MAWQNLLSTYNTTHIGFASWWKFWYENWINIPLNQTFLSVKFPISSVSPRSDRGRCGCGGGIFYFLEGITLTTFVFFWFT